MCFSYIARMEYINCFFWFKDEASVMIMIAICAQLGANSWNTKKNFTLNSYFLWNNLSNHFNFRDFNWVYLVGEYFNLNVYYTRMYLIGAAKYFNNICVECRDLKHICEMLQIKSFERVLLCISISAFTIHFYCHQRKHSARCTAFFCLPFSILSCAMKQLVRPSHMNWNMKLVMLDFWLICWYFFFRLCVYFVVVVSVVVLLLRFLTNG